MAVDYQPAPGYRTAAELLEDLGATIAERYALAEVLMIERVRRALLDGDEAAPGVARLETIQDLRRQGEQIALTLADSGVAEQIVAVAAQEGRAAAAQLLTSVSLPTASGIGPAAAAAIASTALDLTSGLQQMSARITRWMPDQYQRAVSLLAPQVIGGVATGREAQRAVVQRLLAQGVNGFESVDGRTWRIGSYAEMATRTAVQRAWVDAHVQQMQDSAGIGLVSIVGGVDTCSRCAPHIGRVWSVDGTPAGDVVLEHATESGRMVTVTVAGTLEQARSGGWGHPNCRCTVAAYMPGLRIARGSTYSAKSEADRDRLRALERHVRDWKRREAAALDDLQAAQARRKVRQWQGRIRSHVASTGQLRKPYREQLGFADGLVPAVPRARPAALAAP